MASVKLANDHAVLLRTKLGTCKMKSYAITSTRSPSTGDLQVATRAGNDTHLQYSMDLAATRVQKAIHIRFLRRAHDWEGFARYTLSMVC